jgi:3-mercaptopyruvate sulfurtransferase SseA
VPLDTLREHVSDLAGLEHPVVLVCQSGGRASQAHESLSTAGKSALHILEGGMSAWLAAGGDVVRSTSPRWAMDRQVRLVAGAIALFAVGASVFAPKAKWIGAGVAGGLVYSAVFDTCALANVLARLPHNRGRSCDIASVLADLNRAEG